MKAKRYQVWFIGRKLGALGVTHGCVATVYANSHEEAALAVNDTHEHIQRPIKVRLLEESPWIEVDP